MRTTAAFLADAAQVQRGKLYVLGGGISTITTRRLPAIHPAISLVLLVEIEPHEWEQDLGLRITLIDEDGHNQGIDAKGRLRVGRGANRPPGESALVPMVSNFISMRLQEAKGYAFAVSHEDEEIARVQFRVHLAGSSAT